MNLHLPEVTSMDNASLEKDSNTRPKGDVSLKMGLEMTQCNAGSSSCLEKKKKKKRKRKNNTLKGKDINDNHPKDISINVSPVKTASLLHLPVNKCLSTDLEMRQPDPEVSISQTMENGEKQNKRHNALMSNGSNQDFQESGCQPGHYLTNTEFIERVDSNSVSEVGEQLNSFQKCLGPSSTKKHNDQPQFITYQKKKQVTQVITYQRTNRKLSDSKVSSLGSIEGASPLVQVVRDSSARDTSLNHLDEAPASGFSEKMLGEVGGGNDTSLLLEGDISLEKASGECPDGETASGEQENKTKMEKLEENINERSVVKDASQIDLLGKKFEQGNRDKLDVIQNAVLDVYSAEEILHKSMTFYKGNKASDDVSHIDPSVDNLESDNLDIQPKLKDAILSPSQVSVIAVDVSLAVIRKEGSRQTLQLSLAGAPPDNSRKKLLVLDVNGLLADIVSFASERYKPDTVISNKAVFKRPFCDDFLQFCFERFHVGVWSSRTKRNVESVLDFLMGKSKHNLLFCWNQSHCTGTGFNTVENRDKPLLLKELKKLWEKHEPDLPWERGEYNESNTLLLDDSPYKALRNAPHTAIFPHTYQYNDVKDNSLGPCGDLRVYLEGLALANNVQKYVELNPFGQRPITKTNLSWAFYLKVIGTTSSVQEEDAKDSSACL